MTVVQLRELARANKVRLPYGVNKAQMVETLFRQLGSGEKEEPAEKPEIGLYKPKPFGFYDEEYGTSNPVVPQMLKAGLLGSGRGLLEVQPGGYGFLRTQNGTPGADDIYVSIAQIRRFNLHSGDEIIGKTRPKRLGDRYNALMYIESVNGDNPEIARMRRPFDSLTPIHPNRRLTLESADGPSDPSMRLLDFIAPIGLGQRALIVAPPKAGKTILLQKIARAIEKNHPDIELMILLIDERPEEVTDIRRSVRADVFDSTFDSPQEN
ncbi:MAG: transcription termination factor Rho, partial [Clostridiales bacterium]|nr:transcription termination factor Rho [Clostridiales bacterium]